MAEQTRVAVIGRTGHGDYGHSLDTVWLEIPETRIVAVADDDPVGLAAASKRLNVDKAFGDYRVMLDEVKPQIVSIGPRWIDKHHEIAMACAERGIHMYLEKPFCRTLQEADELIATCERTHTRLALACQSRYSPRVAMARKLLLDGLLGRVLEFRARGKEDGRGGAEDLWVLGTHTLDLIQFLCGDPDWCFGEITALGKRVTRADVREGNEGLGPLAGDAVHATYGMKEGRHAYFSSIRNAGKGDSRFALQIFGTEGILEVMFGYMGHVRILQDASWSPSRSGKKWQNVSSAGVDQPESISKGGIAEGNRAAVLDLIAATKEQREPLCNMYTARTVLEMIHAVFDSHRQRRPVQFPLGNRQHALTMLTE